MNKTSKVLYYILMLLAALVTTALILHKIVINPGSIVLEMGGDSIKNYFSFIQHAKHGDWFSFSGMNYPYGENIIYADGQPLLSILLQRLGVSDYNIILSVLHLAMALGMFLCIVYCYKVFTYFKVHPLFAIVAACIIPIASPQLIRVMGHFGLSYMCIVPMLFYWSVKYNSNSKLLYPVIIFIAGSIFSLLHPYLAALAIMWVIFYVVAYFLSAKATLKGKFLHVLPMILVIILIVAFVKTTIAITDDVIDRSTYPYGIFSDCTTYISLFTSNWSPIWTAILGENYPGSRTEGTGYPGLVVLLIVTIAIITIITRAIRRQKVLSITSDSGFKPVWLLMALFSIILAHGAPLIWMPSIVDYVAALRQFRTLGRFIWIFYYIATIYSVILLYAYYVKYREKRRKISAVLVLILPILFWFWEAKPNVDVLHKRQKSAGYNYDFVFSKKKYNPDWSRFLDQYGYRRSDFQAIMTLPFFHIGSEKLWIYEGNAWMCTIAIQASLQLDLPIIGVHMSRTSWSQTFEQVKLLSGPYSDKSILDSLPNSKPIMLICGNESSIDDDIASLIRLSDSIGLYNETQRVYALYPDKLKSYCDSSVHAAIDIAESVVSKDTVISCDKHNVVIDHFDELYVDSSVAGRGAWSVDSQQSNEIFRSYNFSVRSPGVDSVGMDYEVSLWAKVNTYNYRNPKINVDILDRAGAHIKTIVLEFKQSVDNTGYLWLRASKFFKMPSNAKSITVYAGEDQKDNYYFLDELLLRPASSLIISKLQQKDSITILANNHIINSRKL